MLCVLFKKAPHFILLTVIIPRREHLVSVRISSFRFYNSFLISLCFVSYRFISFYFMLTMKLQAPLLLASLLAISFALKEQNEYKILASRSAAPLGWEITSKPEPLQQLTWTIYLKYNLIDENFH
jgi:hypothetical protein